MPSWRQVLALVVFGTVMLAGAATFVATVDHDYHYSLDERLEERPDSYPTPYEDLPPGQQATVDAAIAGESFTFQTAAPVPPTLVERDGGYYRFETGRSFDWTDPATAVPVAVTLFGLAGVVSLVYRDMQRNVV